MNLADASNNPNLTCIQVDDAVWSEANWVNVDNPSPFSEDCEYVSNVNENVIDLAISPNPTSGIVNLLVEQPFDGITVTDEYGRVVSVVVTNNSIDLSDLQSGCYFLRVRVGQQLITERILKF